MYLIIGQILSKSEKNNLQWIYHNWLYVITVVSFTIFCASFFQAPGLEAVIHRGWIKESSCRGCLNTLASIFVALKSEKRDLLINRLSLMTSQNFSYSNLCHTKDLYFVAVDMIHHETLFWVVRFYWFLAD